MLPRVTKAIPQLNGRLITAAIAVALSASFYYEPSFPRNVHENDLQTFEKIMLKEEGYRPDKDFNQTKMVGLYLGMVAKNREHDTTYWGTQGIGMILGWRAVEIYGGRYVLLHANALRLFGVFLHFGELAYRSFYPLSPSSASQLAPLSAEEEDAPLRCGCGHHDFGEGEVTGRHVLGDAEITGNHDFGETGITKEIENVTTTTTNTTTTDTATATPCPLSSDPTATNKDQLTQISKLDISLWSKCVHGIYSGMSTLTGITYLFEIAPKGTKSHAVALLSLYLMITATIKYTVEIGISPKVIYASMADLCSWRASGMFTLAAIIVQVILLKFYCSDSPFFLVQQKKNTEKAKKALIELRQTDQVDKELDLLEKKTGQRDPLLRCTLIMTVYIIMLIYNYSYTFFGILTAISNGIPKFACVKVYYVVNILAFFIPLTVYKNLYLITIRNLLLYSYVFLGFMYFINAFVISSNIEYGTHLFKNRDAVAACVIALTIMIHITSTSSLTLFTVILINEYSSQRERITIFMYAGLTGIALTIGALYVFLEGILVFYHFNPMPWIFLGLLIWIVWKHEVAKFGLPPSKFDPFGIFDDCFKIEPIPIVPMKEFITMNEKKRLSDKLPMKDNTLMKENIPLKEYELIKENFPMKEYELIKENFPMKEYELIKESFPMKEYDPKMVNEPKKDKMPKIKE